MIKQLLLLVSFLAALGQSYAAPNDQQIAKGIQYGYDFEFKKADEAFQSVIQSHPKHPAGYFLRTGIFFWQFLFDNENEVAAEGLRDNAEKAIDLADDWLDKTEDDPEALFYLGAAYGALGRYHLLSRNWMSALYYGNKGYKNLQKVIEKKTDYWDAYIGVGMFDYYAAALPSFVTAFLATDGNRSQGLDFIQRTATQGVLLRAEAQVFRAQMLLFFEEDFAGGEAVLLEFLKAYPNNFSAQHMLAYTYYKTGRIEAALKLLPKTIARAESKGFLVPSQRIRNTMAKALILNDQFASVVTLSRSVMKKLEGTKKGRESYVYAEAYWNMCISMAYQNQLKEAKTCFASLEDADISTSDSAEEWLEKPFQQIHIDLKLANNQIERLEPQKSLLTLQEIKKNMDAKAEGFSRAYLDLVHIARGRAYLASNTLERSIEQFRAVVALEDPSDESSKDWAHLFLGQAYRRLGNKAEARKSLKLALKTDQARIEMLAKRELAQLSST
ncbi:MAG: tetratricopeptide repeat protein [Pseudobacteriovorax sp.]|nr:tetratricopeptide repeat protein [Pseudobacteriovorax sp.]